MAKGFNKGAKPLEGRVNVQGLPYKLVERLILARVALAMHIEDMKMNLTKSFPGKDNVLGYCLVETYTCSDLFLPDGGRDYWYNDQSKYTKSAFLTSRLKGGFPGGPRSGSSRKYQQCGPIDSKLGFGSILEIG